ncbi:MAG: transposase [Alphaproteobacteria bacterium]|nr:transposase [Alphaproteobacteria bacterium]
MRFVGLELSDRVPDAKTIWLYRELLAQVGAFEHLFEQFDAMLRDQGWLAMGGQIVDATVIQAQRPSLPTARDNSIRARIRAKVEHVFAAQKCRIGLVIRTIGMSRARAKIGLANLAYNFNRFVWLNGRPASAWWNSGSKTSVIASKPRSRNSRSRQNPRKTTPFSPSRRYHNRVIRGVQSDTRVLWSSR